MLTIAICDDMELYLEKLEKILQQVSKGLASDIKILKFSSGESLLEFMKKNSGFFDVIFLDVYMGAMNGVEVAKNIRLNNKDIPIVFLTSSKEHAVESYRIAAYDYLLKPYKIKEIKEVVKKIHSLKAQTQQKCLLVKSGHDLYTIDLRKVVYFESHLRTITVYFNDKKELTFYKKMTELEKDISEQEFVRVHRSYLVNLRYTQNIVNNDVLTIYNQLIPISKKYLTYTKEIFADYIYDEYRS